MFAGLLHINAMRYEEAREQALYLTDKMAYELNLNDEQYEYAYEINLDYLMGLDTYDDLYGDFLTYRNADLRAILHDWQWSLFTAADYFYRPVYWRSGRWFFPIYLHYHHDYYYYSRPSFYYSYRGGHGHSYHTNGWYTSRRPNWNGGFRGHDRNHFGERPANSRPGYSSSSRFGNHSNRGNYGTNRREYDATRQGFGNRRTTEPGRGEMDNDRRDFDSGRRDGGAFNRGTSNNNRRTESTTGRPSTNTERTPNGMGARTETERGGRTYGNPTTTTPRVGGSGMAGVRTPEGNNSSRGGNFSGSSSRGGNFGGNASRGSSFSGSSTRGSNAGSMNRGGSSSMGSSRGHGGRGGR